MASSSTVKRPAEESSQVAKELHASKFWNLYRTAFQCWIQNLEVIAYATSIGDRAMVSVFDNEVGKNATQIDEFVTRAADHGVGTLIIRGLIREFTHLWGSFALRLRGLASDERSQLKIRLSLDRKLSPDYEALINELIGKFATIFQYVESTIINEIRIHAPHQEGLLPGIYSQSIVTNLLVSALGKMEQSVNAVELPRLSAEAFAVVDDATRVYFTFLVKRIYTVASQKELRVAEYVEKTSIAIKNASKIILESLPPPPPGGSATKGVRRTPKPKPPPQ